MARLSEHGIRLSAMSPSFLNSNSTSHTWPFSAVAELTDNASDPGVCAKQIWIDVVQESGRLCLTVTDNGCSMTPNKLHKMLSFGFTEKGSVKFIQSIGVYGNGFKSGSMRLGRDALIFTKNGGCQTVGMLSQTYLENIKAQAVIVPIVPFNQQTKSLVITEDSKASLAAILEHSMVTSVEQIHAHFDSIPSKKGTKILIWNIRRGKDGEPEMDFETDVTDIRLPPIQIEELKKGLRSRGSLKVEQIVPEMQYSLRAYLSILYLKPRTQIILRGKKIIPKLISKRLTHIEHDVYKPHFSKERVKVTFGLSPKRKDLYGMMMYHKNRLIKAYEKVGCQLKASGQRAGVGVIGVIECNFLKPAHNKQDFEYTKEYRLTLSAFGIKLNDYWKALIEKQTRERAFQTVDQNESEEEQVDDETSIWLQCEECLKWRSIPPRHYDVVPENWKCSQNPNPRYRHCSAPEEAEDSQELLTASYQKTHKKEPPKTTKQERMLLDDQTSPDPAEDHHTDTQVNDDAHTAQKVFVREAVVKDKVDEELPVENDANDQSLEKEDRDKKEHTRMHLRAKEKENTETWSCKRKSEASLYCVKKKPCLLNKEPEAEELGEGRNPEKPTKKPETKSSEHERGSRAEKSDSAPQRILASPHRNNAVPSTQAPMASQLSRTEAPPSRAPPPEEIDQAVSLQKLAGLEKEAQRLRQLLGLEVTKATRGTMTDCCTETTKEDLVTPPLSTASIEVGCQMDKAESSTSSHSLAKAPGVQVDLGQRTVVWNTEEQAEQSQAMQKTETQGTMRASDKEACEDDRSSQEKLRDIRNNVVMLLTALLPQLDLAGISPDTTDVDNVLQQIVEVNSLKL